jgi:hypothetical protein
MVLLLQPSVQLWFCWHGVKIVIASLLFSLKSMVCPSGGDGDDCDNLAISSAIIYSVLLHLYFLLVGGDVWSMLTGVW